MSETLAFPPIRACIFDVDGLLINSEDIYTQIYHDILQEYGAPSYPWRIKAIQQSRGKPGTLRLLQWANIPVTLEEWQSKEAARQHLFSNSQILPGVAELLETLATTKLPPIQIAIASSANRELFDIKTNHIPVLSKQFGHEHRVFGDDPEMASCEKKPAPDMFLLAKKKLDESLRAIGGEGLKAEECLVFEDSIAGVEAGRRAGMRVVWVPHHGLAKVCKGREQEVLMGITEKNGIPIFECDEDGTGALSHQGSIISEDGRAEMFSSLEDFPFTRYGIQQS